MLSLGIIESIFKFLCYFLKWLLRNSLGLFSLLVGSGDEMGLGRRGSNLRVVVNEHLHKFRDGYLTLQENEFFILFLGVLTG